MHSRYLFWQRFVFGCPNIKPEKHLSTGQVKKKKKLFALLKFIYLLFLNVFT